MTAFVPSDLLSLLAQVTKHEIPGLARDMINAYVNFLREHYSDLGADGAPYGCLSFYRLGFIGVWLCLNCTS